MKVYVDELPNSCEGCPCCNECMDYGTSCNLDDIKLSYYDYAKTRHSNCPLQSLADYTKQVRKEAIAEVIQKFKYETKYDTEDEEFDLSVWKIFDILDQIQGEK